MSQQHSFYGRKCRNASKGCQRIFSKIMQSGGTLTIKLYLAATSEGKFDQAFGIAVVLLVIVFLINILTKVLAKKFQAK